MANNPQPKESLDLNPVFTKSDQDSIVTAICSDLENLYKTCQDWTQ